MSANMLKIIALVSMTIDHMGLMLFPDVRWMRIVGRIAFPIFAFMIAEGCRYTHDRKKYLLRIGLLGIGMQVVYYLVSGSLYQSVFISFTLAILLIYAFDHAKKEYRAKDWLIAGIMLLAVVFLCLGLPKILDRTDYAIDYNIVGILIPVVCYFAENKKNRLLVYSLGLVALSIFYGGIQWYCMLAIPLIALYNYKKGGFAIKNLFYIYYPVHLCVISAFEMLING